MALYLHCGSMPRTLWERPGQQEQGPVLEHTEWMPKASQADRAGCCQDVAQTQPLVSRQEEEPGEGDQFRQPALPGQQ